jgi:hypothetical protein
MRVDLTFLMNGPVALYLRRQGVLRPSRLKDVRERCYAVTDFFLRGLSG